MPAMARAVHSPWRHMSLAQLFRSPFVRIPFLGFAIFSSVATSQPDGWSLSDGPPSARIEIAAGDTAARDFAYETSESQIGLTLDLDTFAASSGPAKLHLVAKECGLDELYERRTDHVGWFRLDSAGGTEPGGEGKLPQIHIYEECLGKQGPISLRIENLGPTAIGFAAKVQATITGAPQETPPGAFVRMWVVQ
jgi:hypothetical protein